MHDIGCPEPTRCCIIIDGDVTVAPSPMGAFVTRRTWPVRKLTVALLGHARRYRQTRYLMLAVVLMEIKKKKRRLCVVVGVGLMYRQVICLAVFLQTTAHGNFRQSDHRYCSTLACANCAFCDQTPLGVLIGVQNKNKNSAVRRIELNSSTILERYQNNGVVCTCRFAKNY